MFKTYSSSSSLVITSRCFATSRLRAPVSVRLVYFSWLVCHNISSVPASCLIVAAQGIWKNFSSSVQSLKPKIFFSFFHFKILASARSAQRARFSDALAWWKRQCWCLVCNRSHVDGLVQERCNSMANTLELRVSCTKPCRMDVVMAWLMGGLTAALHWHIAFYWCVSINVCQ